MNLGLKIMAVILMGLIWVNCSYGMQQQGTVCRIEGDGYIAYVKICKNGFTLMCKKYHDNTIMCTKSTTGYTMVRKVCNSYFDKLEKRYSAQIKRQVMENKNLFLDN